MVVAQSGRSEPVDASLSSQTLLLIGSHGLILRLVRVVLRMNNNCPSWRKGRLVRSWLDRLEIQSPKDWCDGDGMSIG